MLYIVIVGGLILGGLFGYVSNDTAGIMVNNSIYYFLIILALINSIIRIVSKKNIYDFKIKYCFIHVIFDIILSLVVGYFSSKLGVPFYLVVAFVFGNNIYQNVFSLIKFDNIEKNNR